MSKSITLRLTALAVVAVGLSLVSRSASGEPVSKKPNVLFIAVDDLNDWVNCLGGRKDVYTPNIDRLAARGVLFANAHCASPACNPSRVCVMTGVRASTSGIYRNAQDWRRSPRLADAATIPEHFRANGYLAFGGGKIFHALSWIEDNYGKQQNDAKIWDWYYPSKTKPMPDALWPAAANAKRSPTGYVSWTPLAQGKTPKGRPSHFFDWGPLDEPEAQMADYKVVDWAIEQFEKTHDKPFFQAVGIFRPHIPWFAPRACFNRYPLDEVFLPETLEGDLDDCSPVALRWCRQGWQKWLVENDQWRGAVQGYLACISFADSQVGRLLDALDRSPYADNTIVVLWSDHGMHIGEKNHWEKFTLWEESTRVPLFVKLPDRLRAKLDIGDAPAVCREPVSLLDVYPTLAELAGFTPPPLFGLSRN